jgi:hypothetical protein
MPLTEKDRKRKRRQRRRRKIKKLKDQLKESNDLKQRQLIIAKLQKLNPWIELPNV